MRNSTLLFLIKKEGARITDICLAMKKRGFGIGRYNGAGGKVEKEESIEDGVKREAQEEIGVAIKEITKCAELAFTFPHKEEWNQLVHVYLAEKWEGEIVETEEMNPFWFKVEDIPYEKMWSDDMYWLPQVLNGKYVKGNITFGEGDVVIEQNIKAE